MPGFNSEWASRKRRKQWAKLKFRNPFDPTRPRKRRNCERSLSPTSVFIGRWPIHIRLSHNTSDDEELPFCQSGSECVDPSWAHNAQARAIVVASAIDNSNAIGARAREQLLEEGYDEDTLSDDEHQAHLIRGLDLNDNDTPGTEYSDSMSPIDAGVPKIGGVLKVIVEIYRQQMKGILQKAAPLPSENDLRPDSDDESHSAVAEAPTYDLPALRQWWTSLQTVGGGGHGASSREPTCKASVGGR